MHMSHPAEREIVFCMYIVCAPVSDHMHERLSVRDVTIYHKLNYYKCACVYHMHAFAVRTNMNIARRGRETAN